MSKTQVPIPPPRSTRTLLLLLKGLHMFSLIFQVVLLCRFRSSMCSYPSTINLHTLAAPRRAPHIFTFILSHTARKNSTDFTFPCTHTPPRSTCTLLPLLERLCMFLLLFQFALLKRTPQVSLFNVLIPLHDQLALLPLLEGLRIFQVSHLFQVASLKGLRIFALHSYLTSILLMVLKVYGWRGSC